MERPQSEANEDADVIMISDDEQDLESVKVEVGPLIVHHVRRTRCSFILGVVRLQGNGDVDVVDVEGVNVVSVRNARQSFCDLEKLK